MMQAGLNITINTDDPGISHITLTDEYRLAVEDLGMPARHPGGVHPRRCASSVLPHAERGRTGGQLGPACAPSSSVSSSTTRGYACTFWSPTTTASGAWPAGAGPGHATALGKSHRAGPRPQLVGLRARQNPAPPAARPRPVLADGTPRPDHRRRPFRLRGAGPDGPDRRAGRPGRFGHQPRRQRRPRPDLFRHGHRRHGSRHLRHARASPFRSAATAENAPAAGLQPRRRGRPPDGRQVLRTACPQASCSTSMSPPCRASRSRASRSPARALRIYRDELVMRLRSARPALLLDRRRRAHRRARTRHRFWRPGGGLISITPIQLDLTAYTALPTLQPGNGNKWCIRNFPIRLNSFLALLALGLLRAAAYLRTARLQRSRHRPPHPTSTSTPTRTPTPTATFTPTPTQTPTPSWRGRSCAGGGRNHRIKPRSRGGTGPLGTRRGYRPCGLAGWAVAGAGLAPRRIPVQRPSLQPPRCWTAALPAR